MNPLTNVRNLQKINERELQMGLTGHEKSWHSKYKNSAWIYFGGVNFDLTEGDLLCIFSQYGEIVNINLVRDKKTGKSRGFGFICYEDQRSTILAVDNFNGAKICNRTIRVDHVENYKPPKDSEEYDELTRLLHEKGCGPEVIAEQEKQEHHDASDLDKDEKKKEKARRKELKRQNKQAKAAKKKLKKKKKKKIKELQRELKKEKKHHSSSSSSESASRSSSSDSDSVRQLKRMNVAKQPPTDMEIPVGADNGNSSSTESRMLTNIKQEPGEISTQSRSGSRRYRSSSRSPISNPLYRSPVERHSTHSSHTSSIRRSSSERRYGNSNKRTHNWIAHRSERPRHRHYSSRDDNSSREPIRNSRRR